MSVSMKMISLLLEELELKFRVNEERGSIELFLNTTTFKNANGEHSLFVIVRVGSDGQFVRISAPGVYHLASGPNALPAAKALLWATGVARYFEFSLDLEDEMVDLTATVPVGEGALVSGQLALLLSDLHDAADYLHPIIQTALDEGRIVLPDEEKSEVEALLASIAKMAPDQLKATRKALEEGAAKVEEPEAPEVL